MSFTDYLRLAEHKIFKEACEILPKNVSKPLNLVTVRDSVLFTWDFSNNCVLSLNIKAARSKEGDNVIHQVSFGFNLFVIGVNMFFVVFGKKNITSIPRVISGNCRSSGFVPVPCQYFLFSFRQFYSSNIIGENILFQIKFIEKLVTIISLAMLPSCYNFFLD